MTEYWERRKNLEYYTRAVNYVLEYGEKSGALLEVGGNVTGGCRYLERLPGYKVLAIEHSKRGDHTIPNVEILIEAFEDWNPKGQVFDVALCLQTVEHVADPKLFLEKLFSLAPVCVLSIPYMWSKGKCEGHLHDPIDEAKLESWAGREPTDSVIADRRLVAVYVHVK